MSHKVAVRGIDLLGQEVIPALKAYQADRKKGKWQLGLKPPFRPSPRALEPH